MKSQNNKQCRTIINNLENMMLHSAPYLFNSTQAQRNYTALYFKRKGARDILVKAVNKGCIDRVQAFSK
ncbi:hypothetical protein CAL7716_034400 [Calothrix sp. PCC 7716]|nr:hypothetical protein CAL7716_034400 [Calothrix sp. PCC 7716]